MNPVLYFVDENQAALVLRLRLGGSIKGWRKALAEDRGRIEPLIPFEGTATCPQYPKHAVHDYALAQLQNDPDSQVEWGVNPEFDHELGYPRVHVTLSRGTDSVWAVLDPEDAKAFASALQGVAEKLTGMTFEDARQMLQSVYGPASRPSTAELLDWSQSGGTRRDCGEVAAVADGPEVDRQGEPENEAPFDDYIYESDEPVMDPEWVEAQRREAERMNAEPDESQAGDGYVDG